MIKRRKAHSVSVINQMMRKLDTDTKNLSEGLDPDVLAGWYDALIKDAIGMAPPWLADKIAVKRDPILRMKFGLDISRRAVRYFIMAIDGRINQMPYSTGLYFLKVQQEVESEMDKTLV